jgi:hypothetical protein
MSLRAPQPSRLPTLDQHLRRLPMDPGPNSSNAGHVAVVNYVSGNTVDVYEQNYGGIAHEGTYTISGTGAK